MRAKLGKPGSILIKAAPDFSTIEIISKLQAIPGKAKQHPTRNLWRVKHTTKTLNLLKSNGASFLIRRGHELDWSPLPLRQYQRDGAQWLYDKAGRGLLADEPGLGKTIQTIAYLKAAKAAQPVLIICPASLKFVWADELVKWKYPYAFTVVEGRQSHKMQQSIAKTTTKHGAVIINYDILDNWLPFLLKLPWAQIVCDEIHYIKNPKTKRAKAVCKLGLKAGKTIGLSGTPIVNRPDEAWNSLHVIQPTLFPNRFAFRQRYCGAKRNYWGWTFTGATNTAELHKILTKSVMLRRLKRDYLKELPEKQFCPVPLSINNTREYQALLNDTAEGIQPANALAKIQALRLLAVYGKLPQALQWLNMFLENETKLLVMAHHQDIVRELANGLVKHNPVTFFGGTSAGKKREAVHRFNNDPNCHVFIGNIKAAGTGLTLTAAHDIAFVELPWSPGDFGQAIDRIHRIGQTANSLNIHLLLARKTIDMYMAKGLLRKLAVLDDVLDGKEQETTTLFNDTIEYLQRQRG